MIDKVYLVESSSINPYYNQALQQYLFDNIPDDSMIFMIWQNKDSLSLANTTNTFTSVNIDMLEKENTYLCRRKTGGKVLYNDLGVINYCYFMYYNNYNILEQVNVLYQTLANLGLPVYLSDRNEIMLNGKQITDSYFQIQNEKCLHGGSLYWDCDMAKRTRLVKGSLKNENIANLSNDYPIINIPTLKKKVLQSLADSFGSVYQFSPSENIEDIMDEYRKISFIYNSDKPYTLLLKSEYDDEEVQVYVEMLRNKIIKVDIYHNNLVVCDYLHSLLDNLVCTDVAINRRISAGPQQFSDLGKDITNKIKKESYHF